MAHVDCPTCSQRLRIPDSQGPLTFRCPACGGLFGKTPPGDDGASSASPAHDQEPAPAGAEGPASSAGNRHILSAADEAMLRDFGSGSGLLELTREAYQLSPGLDVHQAPAPQKAAAPATKEEAPALPKDAPPAPVSPGGHEFRLVATALTLANTLVQTHKDELRRTRREARLAWGLLGAVTILASGLLAWGISSLGSVRLAQAGAADAAQTFDRDRVRLSGEAEGAKAEAAKLQADLATAREQAAVATARASVLDADLKDAKASLAAANADLGAAKARAASLAAELERAKPPAATQTAKRDSTP